MERSRGEHARKRCTAVPDFEALIFATWLREIYFSIANLATVQTYAGVFGFVARRSFARGMQFSLET
jgi:hypothetical protein